MNRDQLKRKFPNASETFLAANEDRCAASRPKPQRSIPRQSLATPGGEGGDTKSIHVRITSFRRRLIDPDNLCPKYFVDCLRYAGLITDDSSRFITLEVRQHQSDNERTEIEITNETRLGRD